VNQFTLKPILHPSGVLVIIIHDPFFFLKKRIIHFALGSSNDQFELLIRAAVAVLAGIVIVKLVDVLSEPKSSTAIDLLP